MISHFLLGFFKHIPHVFWDMFSLLVGFGCFGVFSSAFLVSQKNSVCSILKSLLCGYLWLRQICWWIFMAFLFFWFQFVGFLL